jgi:hypothetical protein
MGRMATAGARLRTERRDAPVEHQRADRSATDARELGPKQAAQHARAGEGKVQVERVDLAHEGDAERRHRPRRVVHRARTALPRV